MLLLLNAWGTHVKFMANFLSLAFYFQVYHDLDSPHSRGGECSKKFYMGDAMPWGPSNPSPFYIPLLTENKWYPFHLPCLELCIIFKCCKCTVFNKLENQNDFLTFPQPKKASLSLLGFFTDRNDRFPCPLIYFITGSTPLPLPGSYSFELFKYHVFFHDLFKFSKTLGLTVTFKIF